MNAATNTMKVINEVGQLELMCYMIANVKGATLENQDPFFNQAEDVANNTTTGCDMVLQFRRHETHDSEPYSLTMPVEWFDEIECE